MDNQSLDYAKKHKKDFFQKIITDKQPTDLKDAVFITGSPGAGKTEVSEGLAFLSPHWVSIDADYFRRLFPGYDGKNSSEFQRGSSYLVDFSFTEVLKKGYSFILDGTFAIEKSKQNVERSLKRDYQVTIYYVYQAPLIAWEFTKEREKEQGRVVPKETFINAYFKLRQNIGEIIKQFNNQITVNIVQKDYQNNISDTQFDVKSIDLLLPERYTKTELEELLHD